MHTGLFNFEEASGSAGWIQELTAGHAEHTPETEEYGISSFVYKRRLPFHVLSMDRSNAKERGSCQRNRLVRIS